MSWRWFNLGSPWCQVGGKLVRPWNLFNRHTADGEHWWGVGILQVGNRHLAYVGHSGVSVLFLGRTP